MMMQDRRLVGLRCRFPLTLVLVVTLIALLTSVGLAAVQTEVVGPRTYTVNTPEGLKTVRETAASGRLIVQLSPGATAEDLQDLLAEHNATLLREIPGTGLLVIGLPEGQSVVEARAKWTAEPQVVLSEPDYLMHWTAAPNDPLYDQQWQFGPVAAEAGWDVQTGSANVTIAICDSGYDPDHEDLVDKWWVNQAEAAGQADVDDDNNGFVDDIYGWDFAQDDNDPDAGPASADDPFVVGGVLHGTHCAGLAGATTDNSTGVAGHDWGAQIMAVRVGDSFGPFTSDTIAGIQYAVANGADVISLSIGGPFTPSYDTPIANAHAAGVTVVVAAGNSSHVFTDEQSSWNSPVCNDGPNLGVDNFVLGVGASAQGDVAADFTNRDGSSYNFVDVMAPGVEVWSTYYHNPAFPEFSTEYGPMSGTSMACPFTAGLAGLVKAQYPGFSAADVINQIRASADNIDDKNPLVAGTLGEGRINTAAALGLDVPPEPVGNLAARDTLGDEGGSITVTWSLPPEDDEDVIGYNLLRASESQFIPNTPGNFSQIANLEPGTSAYIDAPVPDDTPYWYQVITLDQSNAVPSSVAGPARARDDLPPPPIENLVAVDTQADVGGAITLSWLGYDPPEDLVEYRIYRATADITDVADLTPLITLGPEHSLHYVDRTTQDGTEYWYAVTGVDDFDNEETEVTSAGPVISNPNFSFNYPMGMSIISLGAIPSEAGLDDIDTILGLDPAGDANLAYWDPSSNGGEYILWSETPGAAVFTHQLGRSWWLKTPVPILVNMSGQAAPEGDFQRQVVSGWNQIGNPFPNQLDFSLTEVTGIGQGTPVSLETSNQLGYTRDYAWAYDTRTNSYRLVAGADLPFATKTVEKGRGVLFLAKRPATLLLKREVITAADADAQTAEFDGWALRLVAEAQGMADTDNFLGVCANADEVSGVVSPPRPDADLDLYFVRPAADGGRMATDFVAPEGAREWEVRVACAIPQATVRLSWPDLSELPGDVKPMLVDNETGRTIYLRTSTGYTYEVGDEATARSFTLRLADDGASALAINTLSAGATAGRGQIVYTLSQDAAVDIEVLNIAGVTVRRILAGRVQEAGPQQVTWDGRNASGSNAPSGTYIIRVTARSNDGQQVSAIRSLQLER